MSKRRRRRPAGGRSAGPGNSPAEPTGDDVGDAPEDDDEWEYVYADPDEELAEGEEWVDDDEEEALEPDAVIAADGAPATPAVRNPGRIVRFGCIALGALGILGVVFAVQFLTDPADARCSQARLLLDQDFDETPLVVWAARFAPDQVTDEALAAREQEIDDLPCEEAIAQANALPRDDIGSEDSIKTQGILLLVIAGFQVIAAAGTALTLHRHWRIAALGATAFGLALPALGVLTIVVIAFVAYALHFSADARATFGLRPRTGGLFGPRPSAGDST